MKATVTSKQGRVSKDGGRVFLLTFKGEDGRSYISWLDPKNGNYKRWEEVSVGDSLDGLILKYGNLIDADSFPVKV